jgi:pimeloyl-ACP methyl ester carboxylesterase
MEAGRGDPLLFLHGWGLSPRSYQQAVVRLCAAGVRVMAPSLPGFGRSDPLPVGAPLPVWGAHIGALVDRLDPELAPFVVGHSMGGGVGIQLALQRPDLVRSLTLVNTIGGRPGRGAEPIADGSWLAWIAGAATELDPRQWMSPRIVPTLAGDFLGNLRRHPVSLFTSMITAATASLSAEARHVVTAGIPTLLVWGDRDKLTVPGPLATVAGELGTETVQGKHGWMLTEPEEFGRVIHDALVVQAMLERRKRGTNAAETVAKASQALRLPEGVSLSELLQARADLAALFPVERRRRSRWP